MGLFWDLYRGATISEAHDNAEIAKNTSQRLRRDFDQLRRQNEATSLACQAMWEILRDQLGVSEASLIQKMQEIDQRDRRTDGTTTQPLISCTNCGNKNNTSRSACLYCGVKLPSEDITEAS